MRISDQNLVSDSNSISSLSSQQITNNTLSVPFGIKNLKKLRDKKLTDIMSVKSGASQSSAEIQASQVK